jgi:hypothetical protein
MNITARRTAATVGTAVVATSVLALSPAQAAAPAPSSVTVNTTDATPASGQTFRLFGAVSSGGVRVAATIHVKTLQNGHFVQLPGAVVSTNNENRYRVRIILQRKGPRQLRVVATPKSPDIATSRNTITVTVH